MFVDEPDELFGIGLLIRVFGGVLGSGRVDGRLIMEAIEVTPGLLKFTNPFLGL